MKLPNYPNAFIDDKKFIDYCLNPEHAVGKHKAQVFQSALGITAQNYLMLKQSILNAIATNDCITLNPTEHGKLFAVDFEITTFDHRAAVRSSWIIKNSEDFPRLITCYVKA